ncbi:MAG: mechanosensitive ion channel family protein [Pseudomonadota bacterium]|nr:mechanosensitive ion channel family protein [Pseudomonadota bacterium]
MSSSETLRIFGVTLIGATPENFRKLLLTFALIAAALLITWVLRALLRSFIGSRWGTRFHFWTRQVVSLAISAILILTIVSIWFDDPTRLATAVGLIGAGLAFALQKVITAVAGYFVILRGKTFNVGDRIVMGGVRGDVIALSFMQTKIMEMGQPPPMQQNEPSVWVKSRQFTGRIVTVTNDKIFSEPVFNYTDQFPYVWEEIGLSIHFDADRVRAEEVMIEAARNHAVVSGELQGHELERLERRYGLEIGEIDPKAYWRLADGWIELTVRFLVDDHGIREVKDAVTREIIAGFDAAGIKIASTSFEISAIPPLRIERIVRFAESS